MSVPLVCMFLSCSFSSPLRVFSSSSLCQGPDPRPVLIYSSLQFLDIVLIRSRVHVNGFGLDSRLASTIRYGSLGLQLPELQHFSKWDRVGLIQLPSFIEKHEYDPDNIEVTEATYFGIQTRTLRQVLDSAFEVSIRSLKVGSQIAAHEAEQSRLRAEAADRRAGRKSPHPSMPNTPAHAVAASIQPISDDGDDSDENSERLEYLQKYYQFTGPVINRAYGQCMDKLESMFRFVSTSLKSFELSSQEILNMHTLLEKYIVPFVGLDGQPSRGIPFGSLLTLFRDMSETSLSGGILQNTFSDGEIFELVSAFTMGDDRVSLSNNGFISEAEFFTQWKASLERTLPLRRIPREILSGAFVSQALQQIGVLPQSSDAYYLPMDFAMLEQPNGIGWEIDTWTKREREKEAADRAAAIENEQRLTAHLPKLTGPGATIATQPTSPAPSSPPLPSASASSSSPSLSVDVDPDSSSSSSLLASQEGSAIVRIHRHGQARIGHEQQVPHQMNSTQFKEEDKAGR